MIMYFPEIPGYFKVLEIICKIQGVFKVSLRCGNPVNMTGKQWPRKETLNSIPTRGPRVLRIIVYNYILVTTLLQNSQHILF